MDSGDQMMQATIEEGVNIEDLKMVSKENEHSMDPILLLLLEKSNGSSEDNYII